MAADPSTLAHLLVSFVSSWTDGSWNMLTCRSLFPCCRTVPDDAHLVKLSRVSGFGRICCLRLVWRLSCGHVRSRRTRLTCSLVHCCSPGCTYNRSCAIVTAWYYCSLALANGLYRCLGCNRHDSGNLSSRNRSKCDTEENRKRTRIGCS